LDDLNRVRFSHTNGVAQRSAKGFCFDLDLVTRLDGDTVREAQRRGAQEVRMYVPRAPELGVFEVMILQIGDGV
jgi:endonuclease YncB( thermonuclease family)